MVTKRRSPLRATTTDRQRDAQPTSGEHLRGCPLGTKREVATFGIDWQDSDATIYWVEQILHEHPRGTIALWIDRAGYHTSEGIEDRLEVHPRLRVSIVQPILQKRIQNTATGNPSKKRSVITAGMKRFPNLSAAINHYYQKARTHTVNSLERFGYYWRKGRIYPLPLTS